MFYTYDRGITGTLLQNMDNELLIGLMGCRHVHQPAEMIPGPYPETSSLRSG